MLQDQTERAALAAYLTREVPEIGQLQSLQKFSDGQSNPTYLLTADSGQYVLRRQPPGELLKSAHAVDREYRVIAALADSEVPVARAIHLCLERDVIGSLFYDRSVAGVGVVRRAGVLRHFHSSRQSG